MLASANNKDRHGPRPPNCRWRLCVAMRACSNFSAGSRPAPLPEPARLLAAFQNDLDLDDHDHYYPPQERPMVRRHRSFSQLNAGRAIPDRRFAFQRMEINKSSRHLFAARRCIRMHDKTIQKMLPHTKTQSTAQFSLERIGSDRHNACCGVEMTLQHRLSPTRRRPGGFPAGTGPAQSHAPYAATTHPTPRPEPPRPACRARSGSSGNSAPRSRSAMQTK